MSKVEQKVEPEDELRPEYDLAELLKHAVRGKYAARYKAGTNLVLLAPDVAKAFPDEQAVNEALRLVMQLAKIPSPQAEQADSTEPLVKQAAGALGAPMDN